MAENTVVCKCGNTEEIEGSSNSMGNVIKAGWGVVATFDGKLLKLCPNCNEELVELANKIYDLTGSKYVSLSNVIS